MRRDEEASWPCTILHLDMDAFFASVEVLDAPELRGRPVVVGGTGERGVVASCTYEARRHGVRSAMSMGEARRRCPGAVVLPGRHERYREVSARLGVVLREVTPVVEPLSLDEAFLDVAGSRRRLGAPESIAGLLRARVREELGLSCAVGAARTKSLAKLASRKAKPTAGPGGVVPGPGVLVITPDAERSFLDGLALRELWGVGPATAARLERFGLTRVAQVARLDAGQLRGAVGRASAEQIVALARGEDPRRVEPDRSVRSISHEETFARDLHGLEALEPHIVRLADAVGARLAEAGQAGRTVTVRVRAGDRSTVSRSLTLDEATTDGSVLVDTALLLLRRLALPPAVRLLGVGVSGLTVARRPRQLRLDDAAAGEEVSAAVHQVRRRFGAGALGPARLVGSAGLRVRRRGDQPWGPAAIVPKIAAGDDEKDVELGAHDQGAG